MELEVTLEELYSGKSIEFEVSKQIVCPHCSGSGARSSDDVVTCSGCQGQGVKIVKHMLAPGMFQQFRQTYVLFLFRVSCCDRPIHAYLSYGQEGY